MIPDTVLQAANTEWANVLADEIWIHVAKECSKSTNDYKFTTSQIKNTSRFMTHAPNLLQMAIDVLLEARKIELSSDSMRARIKEYIVNRNEAICMFPPDADDDEEEEENEDEEPRSNENDHDEFSAINIGRNKLKRKTTSQGDVPKRIRKCGTGLTSADAVLIDDENEQSVSIDSLQTPLVLPSTLPCPVSEDVLSIVQQALTAAEQEGGETKKSLVITQLVATGVVAEDVDRALEFLSSQNKILMDDDDLYFI